MMGHESSTATATPKPIDDKELAARLHETSKTLTTQIATKVIGQTDTVRLLLTTLFAGGHALFVGVPGLAKTLLVNTLADVLSLSFKRIQFTPDLMPSDITGTELLDIDEAGKRNFRFVQGPVFCNILLADEINRTPPKTQAALLQSMQEGHVTAAGATHSLPNPFHVFATQNPLEQEGTYPLPEAQLDRFSMMIRVEYPSAEEEVAIIAKTTHPDMQTARAVIGPEALRAYQDLVRRVPISDSLLKEAVTWVRRTRPESPDALPDTRQFIQFGAGPRAGQHLILCAKAHALLQGRTAVDKADLKFLFVPVLRHRVVLGFQALSKGFDLDSFLQEMIH